MNDHAANRNDESSNGAGHDMRRVLESMLERLDESSAAGTVPSDFDETPLPLELREEWTRLGELVVSINSVVRATAPTSYSENTSRSNGTTPSAVEPNGAPNDSLIGEWIGRFRILSELGRGGSGVVFLAIDPSIDRKVALKLPRPEVLVAPELRQRFMNEAQAAGRLDHPNVLAVHEVGEDGALCYIVSPYCRGPSLAQWLARHEGRASPRDAAQLVACLADGLEDSHKLGVLHRDIKPGNVLLDVSATEKDANDQELLARPISSFAPKLTDFGLAKLPGDQTNTRTGTLVGTPAYMPPERINGTIDQRFGASDIYGLGVVLYELLTGQAPFQGETDAQTLHKVINDQPELPRLLRHDIPRDLEAICLKCLERNPSLRYHSAGDLAADLRRFLNGEQTVARPLSAGRRLLAWTRRKPTLAGLIAVSVVALCVIAGIGILYTRNLRNSRIVAEQLRATAEASELKAQQRAYAATMRTAQWAWEALDYRAFTDTMAAYEGSRLRGFEYEFLNHLSRRARTTLHPSRPVEVDSITVAPGGGRIATANRDGTIDIWSYPDGAIKSSFRAHDICANVVRFAPHGELLATASCDATIRLWDADSLELIREIHSPGGKINTIRFGPHGKTLYTAGEEQIVRAWSVVTGELQRTFRASPNSLGTLECLALSPDGSLLAAGGRENTVAIWDTVTGESVKSIAVSTGCTALEFVGKSAMLAIAIPDVLRVVPIAEDKEGFTVPTFGRVHYVAAAKTGDSVYCATDRGVVDVLSLVDERLRGSIPMHLGRISDLAVSDDGRYLLTASWDRSCVILDLEAQSPFAPFEQVWFPGGLIRAATASPRGEKIALAVDDGDHCRTVVCGVDDSSFNVELPSQTDWPFTRMSFSFDGDYLHLIDDGDHDSNEIWRVTDSQPVLVQVASQVRPTTGGDPRDAYRIVHTAPNTVQVVEAGVGNIVHSMHLEGTVQSIDCRPGQRWIVSTCIDRAFVWDRQDNKLLNPFEVTSHIFSVDFSEAAGCLALGCISGAYLFDFPSGKLRSPLLGHYGEVCSVAISPDGKTVATGGRDQTIRLWNVATAQEMLVLRGHKSTVHGLAFSNDGSALLSIGDESAANESVEVLRWRTR